MSSLPDLDTLFTVYDISPGFHLERVDTNMYFLSGGMSEYVLRIYPYGTSLDGQRYQHWLLLALESRVKSFAIPAPVRTRDGSTFHRIPNGSTWVMALRLRGSHLQPNDVDQAYAAGNALAELHIALTALQPLPNPLYPQYDLENRSLPHTRGALPTRPADLGLQTTREAEHRLERFVRVARLFQVPPPLPRPDLPWHLVHGEFHSSNLLYDGEQIIGVLDFEHAHPDYRAREFTEALMHVAADLGPLFWGVARAFVDGYGEKLALTRAEIDLVPYFIAARRVDRVLEYCRSRQPVHAAEALRRQEEISAWLEVEQHRLMAMLRGAFLGD